MARRSAPWLAARQRLGLLKVYMWPTRQRSWRLEEVQTGRYQTRRFEKKKCNLGRAVGRGNGSAITPRKFLIFENKEEHDEDERREERIAVNERKKVSSQNAKSWRPVKRTWPLEEEEAWQRKLAETKGGSRMTETEKKGKDAGHWPQSEFEGAHVLVQEGQIAKHSLSLRSARARQRSSRIRRDRHQLSGV